MSQQPVRKNCEALSATSHCVKLNPLTPNDPYSGRTAPLTSKRCILYIYSTNTGTEYFKHGVYSPFFSLQNAVCFIILKYLVPVSFTFLYTGCAKIKNNNSGAKRLMWRANRSNRLHEISFTQLETAVTWNQFLEISFLFFFFHLHTAVDLMTAVRCVVLGYRRVRSKTTYFRPVRY